MSSKGYPPNTSAPPPPGFYPNLPVSNNPPPYEAATHQPAPNQGYYQPPPPQMSQPTHIIHQTVVTTTAVGPDPSHVTCPSCHQQIRTRVDHETTTRTHLCALLLCLFICWPCVCLPYCMDSCKNTNHYCPKCGAFVGTYVK